MEQFYLRVTLNPDKSLAKYTTKLETEQRVAKQSARNINNQH